MVKIIVIILLAIILKSVYSINDAVKEELAIKESIIAYKDSIIAAQFGIIAKKNEFRSGITVNGNNKSIDRYIIAWLHDNNNVNTTLLIKR